MAKKELRPYQQEACKSIAQSWALNDNRKPYAALITGTGKSLVLAALTNRYVNQGKRVLQLVPRLELVEQNYTEAFNYLDKKDSLGIVCGQLQKKQNHKQVVVAMASSFVNLREKSGKFDYCLIDECHRLVMRHDNKKPGTYQKIVESLIKINPDIKICGVTGTPYRLDQGELHETTHKALPFFTHKVFDTSVDPGLKKLIEDGYLSHIETLNTNVRVDLEGVKRSGNDYNIQQTGVKFDAIIDNAVCDMRDQFEANNIRTAIIFCSSIANAQHIFSAWGDPTTMRIVCGDESVCSKQQRKEAIEWMKNGLGCRYIVNVDILTEGFDMRHLECVVFLRATISPGLLVQMVGRVIRPHDDKEHGYLLDYGTNIERLTNGGIENIIVPKVNEPKEAVRKECLAILDETISFEGVMYYPGQACGHKNLLAAKRCVKCKAEFISENEDGLYSMRTRAQALALKQAEETFEYAVDSVYFEQYQKGDLPMIKALFYDNDMSLLHVEYICLDHNGSARGLAIAKIQSLLKNKKDYYQISKFQNGVCVKSVLFLLQNHYEQFFKQVKKITLQKDGKFNKLVSWDF